MCVFLIWEIKRSASHPLCICSAGWCSVGLIRLTKALPKTWLCFFPKFTFRFLQGLMEMLYLLHFCDIIQHHFLYESSENFILCLQMPWGNKELDTSPHCRWITCSSERIYDWYIHNNINITAGSRFHSEPKLWIYTCIHHYQYQNIG